jgi:hypothetical protein
MLKIKANKKHATAIVCKMHTLKKQNRLGQKKQQSVFKKHIP